MVSWIVALAAGHGPGRFTVLLGVSRPGFRQHAIPGPDRRVAERCCSHRSTLFELKSAWFGDQEKG